MIKLNGKSGTIIYVNPDKIVGINAYGMNLEDGSFINYGNDQYIVSQSPEEVVRKIMEYKLAMAEYRALSEKLESSDCDKRLRRLTGLEDTPDAK